MQGPSRRRPLTLPLFVLLLGLVVGVSARSPSPDNAKSPAAQEKTAAKTTNATPAGYAGSEVCITCHEDQDRRFKNTVMGKVMMLNPHNPEEALGCEACHGPGQAHVEAGG